MRTDLVLIDTSVWIFALRKPPIIEIKEKVDFLFNKIDRNKEGTYTLTSLF